MSLKVQVKDYQIVKKASLEFIPGLNVIIGPSNNGKTSILKAIKAAIYTVPGALPIRSGQTSYAVGINYNGHTVILQKGLKESVYLVDGEKYTKFGTTTPEAVSNALNIKELVLNGVKEQLNFWDQMKYPFLLDKSSVELFRFIIDSGEDDQISKALKNMVSDRQLLSKEIDQLQGSINVLDLDINNYEEQLKNADTVLQASNNIIALQSQIAKLNLLKEVKQSLITINTQKVEVNNNYSKSLNKLKIWRDFYLTYSTSIEKLNHYKDLFSNLHNLIGDLSDVVYDLNKVSKIKTLPNINSLELTRLKEIKETINNITKQKENLTIKPVIQFNYPEDILDKIVKLRLFRATLSNIIDKKKEIEKSMEMNKIEYYSELKNLYDICPVCGNKIH